MSTLVVAETFGPTFQGEGPSAGRVAMFLRLAGCNLACSWCDTPYTWDASRFDLRAESQRLDVEEVATRLRGPEMVVITGGEPLLQADAIADLLPHLCGRIIEVETNGTIAPPPWAGGIGWNISPKLPHSGNPTRPHPGWARVPGARFKFVAQQITDLAEIAAFATRPEATWVMPEGTRPDTVLDTARALADGILAAGWNLTLRQHVLLWGAERGR